MVLKEAEGALANLAVVVVLFLRIGFIVWTRFNNQVHFLIRLVYPHLA